jgi:polyisoprenoid-binding protein YceI
LKEIPDLPFRRKRQFTPMKILEGNTISPGRFFMKKAIKSSVVLMSIVACIVQAHAAGSEWKIDPAHSGVYFEIDHIYSAVRGYFEKFDGEVIFDPNDLAGSRFDFKVEVKSVNTGNSKRDSHLQTDEFFDTRKFPDMTFKSVSIKHLQGDQYVVEGTLTVKDVGKTVAVPFTYFGAKTHPFDKDSDVAGFEARIPIDRLAYGVGTGKYYEMGVVGKDVDVLVSIEAMRKK